LKTAAGRELLTVIEVCNISLLVASAVNSENFREILGICEGAKEDRLVGVSRPQRRAVGHFLRLQGACRERFDFLPEAATNAA
jgi:hypothetical protein